MKYYSEIKRELERTIEHLDLKDINEFIVELQAANRIFTAGLGRSGLYLRSFAMRLTQLGMSSFVVGETTTPAIESGDLLLISSKSGKSRSLISYAKIARLQTSKIALISGNPKSAVNDLADCRIIIPEKISHNNENSVLPLGSLFELTSVLLFEIITMKLMKSRDETSETMSARHANLE